MKSITIIATAALIAGGGYFGYTKLSSGNPSDAFILRPLERGKIVQTVSATGTIEPITKVIIGSQVSGNILRWYADYNDHVTEGFVLAELDPDRFHTAYNQASAELAMAQAREEEARVRHKDAERERERIARLMDTFTASENELLVATAVAEGALAAWHAAQASVKSAEAQLNAAKVDLDRTIIRSPIDGVVIARNIDIGQTVAASLQAPELFLIANNLDRMQVNANVAESDVGLIKEGKPATFRVDAYPDRVFEGTISQIRYDATILDGVVTYVTLIEVDNPDLVLRPGMTANVTFEVAKVEGVIKIPNAALRFSPLPPDATRGPPARFGSRTPQVWTVDERGQPRPIEIQPGLSDGSFSELVSGDLKEGDRIITERNWRAGRGSGRPDLTRTLR